MDFELLKKLWDKLGITIPQVTGAAIVIVIFGIILLSFTFIVPILAIGAAFAIIAAAVFLVYKFLGGK
jgi:hypothetical protein